MAGLDWCRRRLRSANRDRSRSGIAALAAAPRVGGSRSRPALRRRGGAALAIGRRDGDEPDGGRAGGGSQKDRDWPAWRIALASFGITFLAELGDLSQLATAGLAARYEAPLSVFVGSFAALLLIASLAVITGAKLVARLRVRLVRRTAAVLFAAFAVLAAYEAVSDFTC